MNAKVEEYNNPTEGEQETEILDSSTALEALNRSEIDIQIATAHKFKRSIGHFKKEALEMATIDEETAGSCFYALKRGDKVIQGPSVRLAEIVGSAWGNLRYGSRIISIDDRFVVAQGACHDLEKNNSATIEVRRRITDRNGRRYNDDMIGVTSMAASSIALRNAIFKVVPFSYAKEIYQNCIKVAVGGAQTLATKRLAMVEYFGKMGVSQKMILDTLGKPTLQDVDLDDLALLKGFITAIKDGETTVDSIFKPADAEPKKVNLKEVKEMLSLRLRGNFKYEHKEDQLHAYMVDLAQAMALPEPQMYQRLIDELSDGEGFTRFKTGFDAWLKTPKKTAEPPKATKKGKKKPAPAPAPAQGNGADEVKQIKRAILNHLSSLPTMDAINDKLKSCPVDGKGFFTFDVLGKSEDVEWLQATLGLLEKR